MHRALLLGDADACIFSLVCVRAQLCKNVFVFIYKDAEERPDDTPPIYHCVSTRASLRAGTPSTVEGPVTRLKMEQIEEVTHAGGG